MTTRRALFACAGAAVVAVACAQQGGGRGERGDGEAVARRADSIQAGTTDAADTFAVAVVDDQGGMCSGTLIAPNLVLTARHCVADDDGGDVVNCKTNRFFSPRAASSFKIDTRTTADFDTAAYAVTKVVVPSETLFCGNDIALLVLGAVVPAAVAKPATPAIEPPLTDTSVFGGTITAIGYGTTKPAASDDGTRRRRDGIAVQCIPGGKDGCDPADYAMTSAELAAGNGLCDGDSGSGAFEPKSLAAGTPIVMGVLSRAADDGTTCSDAVYVRTDTAAALIVAAARDAATAGGYALPAWAGGKGDADAGASADASGSPGGDVPDTTSSGGAQGAAPVTTTTTTAGCSVGRGVGLGARTHRDRVRR